MSERRLSILVSLQDKSSGHTYLVVDLKNMEIHNYDSSYFNEVLRDLQKNFRLTNLEICEMLDTWNDKEKNEKD